MPNETVAHPPVEQHFDHIYKLSRRLGYASWFARYGMCYGIAGTTMLHMHKGMKSLHKQQSLYAIIHKYHPNVLARMIGTAKKLRLNVIHYFAGQLSQDILEAKIDEALESEFGVEGPLLFEIETECAAISLNQTPYMFYEWYSNLIRSFSPGQCIPLTLPLVCSSDLEKKNITEQAYFLGAYTLEEITNLVAIWREEFRKAKFQNTVSFLINGPQHCISVGYLPTEDTWVFCNYSHGRPTGENDEIAKKIKFAFINPQEQTPLNMQLFASEADRLKVSNCINSMQNNTQWQAIQKITPEKAKKIFGLPHANVEGLETVMKEYGFFRRNAELPAFLSLSTVVCSIGGCLILLCFPVLPPVWVPIVIVAFSVILCSAGSLLAGTLSDSMIKNQCQQRRKLIDTVQQTDKPPRQISQSRLFQPGTQVRAAECIKPRRLTC